MEWLCLVLGWGGLGAAYRGSENLDAAQEDAVECFRPHHSRSPGPTP